MSTPASPAHPMDSRLRGNDGLSEHPPVIFLPEDLRDARFACKCCGENHVDPRVEQYVKELEARVGKTLIVASGYRCEKHNAKVGGSPTSSHLGGLAVDISCKSDRLRFALIHTAIKLGVTRIGVYRNFVHLDIDRGKTPEVIWVG